MNNYNETQNIDLKDIHTLEENSLKCLKKDLYTYEHNLRVKEYSILIGQELNLSIDMLNCLSLAAEYHDIGKIELADTILLKNTALTQSEYNEIKKHTEYGYNITKNLVREDIALGIKQHHERIDGSGYPNGLVGDEIHIIAKIIAIADTFDALTTNRPYRKGVDKSLALLEIKKHSGTLFEKEYVEAFESALNSV